MEGKKQLSYYCNSLGLNKGVYLVFYPNTMNKENSIEESKESIESVEISTYLISYDETKW